MTLSKPRLGAVGGAVAVAVVLLSVAPAQGNEPSPSPTDPLPTAVAPEPGEATTNAVPFSVPVSFNDALSAAQSYPGDVLAIAYDNPEISGEYHLDSGVTPAAFLAQFQWEYGTEPAATALIVAAVVPEETDAPAARSASPDHIEVGEPAFVPAPARFSERIQSLLVPPADHREAEANAETSRTVTSSNLTGDWRPTQANYYVTDYQPGRVNIASSYWWVGGDGPYHMPTSWGIEFEVNMFGSTGNHGVRPWCTYNHNNQRYDINYKTRLAAQNQNWNWQVIRPDGQTAPSSLGAYADYNDLGDDCGKSTFAIGLRYPRNIQSVSGNYGIVFVIDAPKGTASESTIQAGTQAVHDGLCKIWPYSNGPKTDCMGVTAGNWVWNLPHATTTLSQTRNRTGPNECWFTDNNGDWIQRNGVWVDPVQYRNDECPEW